MNAVEAFVPRNLFEIPKSILKLLRHRGTRMEIPEEISKSLSHSQKEVFKFLIKTDGRGVLSYKQGIRRPCLMFANMCEYSSVLIVVSDENRRERWINESLDILRGASSTVQLWLLCRNGTVPNGITTLSSSTILAAMSCSSCYCDLPRNLECCVLPRNSLDSHDR